MVGALLLSLSAIKYFHDLHAYYRNLGISRTSKDDTYETF
jgi:hypothetical protein